MKFWSFCLAALALMALTLPQLAAAEGVPTTPTPTTTATPVAYTPKTLKAKCIFPSDKLIEKTLAEQVKSSLAGRGIAKASVKAKLEKTSPASISIDTAELDFTVNFIDADTTLEYKPVISEGGSIGFECSADRTLEIRVSATIAGTKKSSSSKTKVKVLGSLK